MNKIVALGEKYAIYIVGGIIAYLAIRGPAKAGEDAGRAAVGVVSGVVKGAAGALTGAYEALPESVKPSSDGNIIYRTINKAVPGKNATLGTWLFDIKH